MRRQLSTLLLFFVLFIFGVSAQVPNQISWQGVLTDSNGDPIQGNAEIILRIFLSDDAVNETIPQWADTLNINIEDGLVNAVIGEDPNNPLNLSFEQGYWLEIVVNNGTPLSRIKLTSAPYSMMAKTVEDGAITTPKLTNQAVTAPKINPGAVRGSAPGATAPSGQIQGASIAAGDIAAEQVVKKIGNPAALTDNVNLVEGQNVTIKNNTPALGDIEISALGQIKIEVNIDNSISVFIWNPQFNIFNLWIVIWPNGHIWWFHRLIIYETIIVRDPDSDGGIEINPTEGIILRGPNGETVGRWNLDGTSEHMGKETFKGGITIPLTGGGKVVIDENGIRILDDEDNLMTEFRPDGTSFHKGLEQFEGPIYIPLANGGFIVIDQSGIRMYDALENLLYELAQDGTSYHSGMETFADGIRVPLDGGGETYVDGSGVRIYDDIGNEKLVVGEDGSIRVATETGGRVVIDETGITIYDEDHNVKTHFAPNGTSYHAGQEIFAGGIQVTPSVQTPQIQTQIIEMMLTSPTAPPPIQIGSTMHGNLLQLTNNGILTGKEANFEQYVAEVVEAGLGAFELLIGGDFEFDGNGTVGGDLTALGNIEAQTAMFHEMVIQALDASNAFLGSVEVQNDCIIGGDLNVLGEKNFRIDHPDDPYNKYLFHASIESDDVLNQYSGNVVTDGSGYAVVTLPDYVQKINTDFRYQLTVIGQFAQAIISKEIANNTFEIRTDKPNVKVSWQITAKRNDSVMQAKPFSPVRDKEGKNRGKLLFNHGQVR